MGRIFSRINVPTAVAVLAFIMVDRQFDISGRILTSLGTSPRR